MPAALEFLTVDEFLKTLIDARALKTAFELGLVDRLVEHRSGSIEALGRAVGADRQGLRFLLDLLRASGVIEEREGDVRLSRRFQIALRYRDLLEAKLDFAGMTINDFADLFTGLIRDPAGFAGQARLFQLFDYRRCLDPQRAENFPPTQAWMRLTSALTRYEALACMELFDFGGHRHMLDVGGNSGEFLLQLCRRHPELRGTVYDLPVVSEIGMEHILAEPEHPRIGFIRGDVRQGPLPSGYDLISFKSMLHDWPARETRQLIEKAAAALEPGGTILIFERGPLRIGDRGLPFSVLPLLLFFRSYRPALDYITQLRTLGFEDVTHQDIELDTPFYLVTGRKPRG
ncbi:methyltransferase [Bradyrhizobium sp. GCM10027634]|uniref:methyltransferase n=1 Tax=unclassified Bradyrhizobium TaxID=2631580 RepID=UPI00263A6BC1|nr:methyltransferase [Bradyrhizobium sp. WYCCWR 12677]MDN5005282.1 methyltransferase [Bradyrhizobium sp. WYCCWR 12677]